MDLVIYILLGVIVIVVAVLSMRQQKQNRGKSYDQRRDEVYEHYERRMEEFKKTELKGSNSSKDKAASKHK